MFIPTLKIWFIQFGQEKCVLYTQLLMYVHSEMRMVIHRDWSKDIDVVTGRIQNALPFIIQLFNSPHATCFLWTSCRRLSDRPELTVHRPNVHFQVAQRKSRELCGAPFSPCTKHYCAKPNSSEGYAILEIDKPLFQISQECWNLMKLVSSCPIQRFVKNLKLNISKKYPYPDIGHWVLRFFHEARATNCSTTTIARLIDIPDAQCMEYLSTFTPKMAQM